MDTRLTEEDLEWLKRIRSLSGAGAAADQPTPPASIGHKLYVMGLTSRSATGYSITFKGRDELIDRERDAMRWH